MARGYRNRKKRSPGASAKAPRGVIVNGHSERWLRQGFCWVYPDEIERKPSGLSPGDVVPLLSRSGQALGAGVWDDGWIAIRRFREDAGPVDSALLSEKLESAAALRQLAIEPETTAWRLVNGENDGLPGIRVDVYGHFLVVSLDSPSLLSLLEPLLDLLEENESLTGGRPRGIFLAWRPDHRDRFEVASAPRAAGLVRGRPPSGDVRVTERGIACMVRPGGGKDIGLFMDMRDNRSWLEPHWGGRTVLNLFAHTGFFSVCAAYHGAVEVTSVDLSRPALDRAEANFRANEMEPGLHTFIADDTFRALDRLRRTGEAFDLVLLDPPAFSHGPNGTWSASKDYGRLVAASLRVLSPGGWLVGALNLGTVSPRDFHKMVRDGARKAGRRLQLLREGGQPPDFPAAVDFPEGRYLKFAVWRAC